MDLEKLNRIAKIAEDLGFSTIVENNNRATFQKVDVGYVVEIHYDHTKHVFIENVTYVRATSDVFFNLDDAREFTNYIQKAIMLADKLKETKVTGTE